MSLVCISGTHGCVYRAALPSTASWTWPIRYACGSHLLCMLVVMPSTTFLNITETCLLCVRSFVTKCVQHGQWKAWDKHHGMAHPNPDKPSLMVAFAQKTFMPERFDVNPQLYLDVRCLMLMSAILNCTHSCRRLRCTISSSTSPTSRSSSYTAIVTCLFPSQRRGRQYVCHGKIVTSCTAFQAVLSAPAR